MTSEVSRFGFTSDSDTELPDLALERADPCLLIQVEALGDRFAPLSRRLAWDQEVTRATGRWNADYRWSRNTCPVTQYPSCPSRPPRTPRLPSTC